METDQLDERGDLDSRESEEVAPDSTLDPQTAKEISDDDDLPA